MCEEDQSNSKDAPFDLKAAKSKAKEQLGAIPGVEGVGIGDRCIRIYVRDDATAKRMPGQIQGVRIESVITGTISALK